MLIAALLNVGCLVCAIALFRWKKWGFYGYLVLTMIHIMYGLLRGNAWAALGDDKCCDSSWPLAYRRSQQGLGQFGIAAVWADKPWSVLFNLSYERSDHENGKELTCHCAAELAGVCNHQSGLLWTGDCCDALRGFAS